MGWRPHPNPPLRNLSTFSTETSPHSVQSTPCSSWPTSSSNCGTQGKSLRPCWASGESSIKWVTWLHVVSNAPVTFLPPRSGYTVSLTPFYFFNLSLIRLCFKITMKCSISQIVHTCVLHIWKCAEKADVASGHCYYFACILPTLLSVLKINKLINKLMFKVSLGSNGMYFARCSVFDPHVLETFPAQQSFIYLILFENGYIVVYTMIAPWPFYS